jgi:hypothetical protein
MDLYDWYFKQLVSPAELTNAFGAADRAISSVLTGVGVLGLFKGGAVVPRVPATGMGVTLNGPTVAYDDAGNRIAVESAALDVNIAIDELGASTAVPVAGQERWVSVFLKFKRVLSDLRQDGNDEPVYFARLESYEVVIVSGAAAAIGIASRPSYRAGHVLLADIHVVNAQTNVTAPDIDLSRTQYCVRAVNANFSIRQRSVMLAFQSLIDQLKAENIPFVPPVGMTAEDVQGAIEEVRAGIPGLQTAAATPFTPVPAIALASSDVQAAIVEAHTYTRNLPTSAHFRDAEFHWGGTHYHAGDLLYEPGVEATRIEPIPLDAAVQVPPYGTGSRIEFGEKGELVLIPGAAADLDACNARISLQRMFHQSCAITRVRIATTGYVVVGLRGFDYQPTPSGSGTLIEFAQIEQFSAGVPVLTLDTQGDYPSLFVSMNSQPCITFRTVFTVDPVYILWVEITYTDFNMTGH